MRPLLKSSFFSILILASAGVLAESFYDDSQRGWYFGEVFVDPEPEDDSSESESSSAMSPSEILKSQGKQLDDARAKAILEPTRENMVAYMEMNKQVMQQSQVFAQNYKRTIWREPGLDYTANNPVNKDARIGKNEATFKANVDELVRISSRRGLLYFFRSDCPYCARYSPVLKRFSEQYGFTVIPVTLDGKGTEDFPNPKLSYGMAKDMDVSVVPATFLVDPRENKVTPIGYGMLSTTKLVEQILVADKTMDGEKLMLSESEL